MSKDHSEPAFPSMSHEYGPVLGLSIRDYFAAKAMAGFIASSEKRVAHPTMLAEEAYVIADSMLAARVKP